MRIVVAWVGAVVVLAGAIIGGVAILNATVFSASAFVSDYLSALSAGRVDEVRALPGVDAGRLDDRTLDARALEPFRFSITNAVEREGVAQVTVAFSSGDRRGEATLSIERVGSRFGIFPRWGFARSPITPLTVTTTGDSRFRMGTLPLDVGPGGSSTFAVFTPGVYRLDQDSPLLAARATRVIASGPATEVTLAIRPTARFERDAQTALDAVLGACASQAVLFPRGCPFGLAVTDRVISPPHWTIATDPLPAIVPSDELGVWALTSTGGVAHLEVQLQSLFDGAVRTLDEDVPFDASYLIAFDGDELALVPAS